MAAMRRRARRGPRAQPRAAAARARLRRRVARGARRRRGLAGHDARRPGHARVGNESPTSTRAGHPWGGARRCDAADRDCVTDGGDGAAATVAPPPGLGDRTLAGVATLKISVAGRDEGALRVGLFDSSGARVFADLAAGAYKPDGSDATPAAWARGACFCIEDGLVKLSENADAQEVAYRKRFGLRKTPEEFQPARAPKIADDGGAAPKLPPGTLSTAGRGGPGASLEFGLAVAEVDGRNRVPVGVLLDDESMALLAYLGSRPVVSQRAKLGGKAGQPIVKVVVEASGYVTV
ncbi:3',5'-cyclic-nucleotide phosphodiesterase [Aureococcus anophagefferens]|nr:3',5'-cyclic-nucleotide phosphodiesterase [Aureococcus anophagefferens]